MYDKTGNYYTEVIEICRPENLITKLREQYNGHNIFQFFANTTVIVHCIFLCIYKALNLLMNVLVRCIMQKSDENTVLKLSMYCIQQCLNKIEI